MKPAVEAQGLYKTYYTDKAEIQALNNVDFQLEKGQFAIIMGSSGSGKSTLLHVLSGLDSADEGTITLAGNNLNSQSEAQQASFRKEKIGFIFQDFNLIDSLTVVENLLVAGFLTSGKREEKEAQAMELLKQMGLQGLEDRYPSQLSGGQQQRASIARSLINRPEILFADEPTGNLNSGSSAKILEILSELNRQGQTILMVTHDLKAACNGSSIFFLRDGRISDSVNRSPLQKTFDETELYQWLSKRGW